ncbi:MAG: hypothetical protein QXW12_06075 [Nitrososphaerota archaeon]
MNESSKVLQGSSHNLFVAHPAQGIEVQLASRPNVLDGRGYR